jgi:CubicO group peptidase (beta-lactamase class C family)
MKKSLVVIYFLVFDITNLITQQMVSGITAIERNVPGDNIAKLKDDKLRIGLKIDSVFNRLTRDGLFSGEILVSQDADVIIHEYYGKSDFEAGLGFTKNSIFEIASVSKPFTALAIAKLVAQNKIHYSDLIVNYLPELKYRKITIEHLINHTSGLPDYNTVFYPNWNCNEIADNEDLLKILINKNPELLSEPGSVWKYSNIGYTLLAIIIERITGLQFPEFCINEIFSPLGLSQTKIPGYDESKKIEGYVKDYLYSLGDAKYIDPVIYPSFDNATFTADMYGAQGICTSASDLLKFSSFFEHQTLLPDSTVSLYLAPQKIKTPMSDDFTRGWFYNIDSLMGATYFYVGGFSGYRSAFQYSPLEKALLQNAVNKIL